MKWSDELRVTEEELRRAVKRMARKNTAPGPDGMLGKVLGFVFGQDLIRDRLRHLFSECLKMGSFPPEWKATKLVLLRKGERTCYPRIGRFVCWTKRANSWRVIAALLTQHLSRVGPDLADCSVRLPRETFDGGCHVPSQVPHGRVGQTGGRVGCVIRHLQRF